MSLRIQSNIAAMEAQRNLGITSNALDKSLQRLSSGYRINSAADDAAGLSVSNQLQADIASQTVANQNISEANSLLQTASGAMTQISDMLTRLKELATQASSANAGGNLDKINNEAQSLLAEIDRISNSTSYAGTNLLDGSFGVTDSGTGTFTAGVGYSSASGLQSGQTYTITVATTGASPNITVAATIGGKAVSQTIDLVGNAATNGTITTNFAALGLTLVTTDNIASGAHTIIAAAGTASNFQVGAQNNNDNRIGIDLGNTTVAGLNLTGLDLSSAGNAQTALDTIDTAISTLNGDMGGVGAAQNRMGYAAANLTTTIQNNTAANSAIKDVDMAAEMTNFTKNQILLQAGTAMLAQANSAPQQVLALFK